MILRDIFEQYSWSSFVRYAFQALPFFFSLNKSLIINKGEEKKKKLRFLPWEMKLHYSSTTRQKSFHAMDPIVLETHKFNILNLTLHCKYIHHINVEIRTFFTFSWSFGLVKWHICTSIVALFSSVSKYTILQLLTSFEGGLWDLWHWVKSVWKDKLWSTLGWICAY